MSGTVDVSVVTVGCLILNVSRVDSDTTGLLLGCLVNLTVVGELGGTFGGENLGNGSRQGGLTMINMAWRKDALETDAREYDSETDQWYQCSCAAYSAGKPQRSHVGALSRSSERRRRRGSSDVRRVDAGPVT